MKDKNSLSFWEHLEGLRFVLIRSFCLILIGSLISLGFYEQTFSFLKKPLENLQKQGLNEGIVHYSLERERYVNQGEEKTFYFPDLEDLNIKTDLSLGATSFGEGKFHLLNGAFLDFERVGNRSPLFILSPLEGLSVAFKTSLFLGFLGTSPLIFFMVFNFLRPAMRQKEKKLIFPFLFLSLCFLCMGLYVGFFFTTPLANYFLYNFNQSIATNFWTLDSYLSYSLFILISHALAFESAVLLFFLVHIGVITAEQMSSKRRFIYVLSFVFGAILTPPDVFTQIIMASLLISFYEMGIFYAYLRNYFSKRPVSLES